MAKQARSPFDVKLSEDKRDELASWLARELDNALAARTASENEVAYWHTLYEQGRTRSALNSPWPDAADLTSSIATEKVDALRARIVRTVMTEPIWTVEGWGDAAKKAPFVEEFSQWQAEAEGFQAAFARAVHLSLIEPRGVLEVYEDTIKRPVRKRIKAALQLAPDGTALVGANLKPLLQQKPDGTFLEAPEDAPDGMTPPTPSADVVIDSYELVCRGPRHRVVAYRDYLQLPGHAAEKGDVWGHAKRFYRRVDDLQDRVKQGIYDKTAVEAMGTDDERVSETTLAGASLEVPQKEDGHAEKELWELLFLHTLDKTGARWFVATLHKDRKRLLRLQYDDIGRPRYFPLVPFPRPNSTEGYSLVGHKLITTIEEHTAWRNLTADRASIQMQAPMKRMQGALWDPDDEPIGPKAVITVRDMREVQPLEMPDYTSPGVERIRDTERQAEKIAGVTDLAAGVTPQEDRTLGERQMQTAMSEVRIDEIVRNIQEPVEEIGQVRLLMWKRALAEMGEDGMEPSPSMLQGLETRGVDVLPFMPNKKLTASLLEGAFRFKPKGSVETADRQRNRQDFNSSLQAIAALSKVNPMVAAVCASPQAAKAFIETWARLYNVADKQAFLGSEAMQAMQQAALMGMPGAGPGVPPGGGSAPSHAGPPPGSPPGGMPAPGGMGA